jgi:poly-gamma-glutamate synthesis protein (capsule biosynthesis protein)
MRFTFDAKVAQALADAGFGAVSLANNHIYDFGREGIASTVAALDAAGVASFGAPGRAQVATTSIAGRELAFVAFNEFMGEANPERAISDIWKARKAADFVAVYAHWGEEYAAENAYQRALAHRFIDAGADMVVGAHPHVIQGHEAYQGGHIYYSLGNFIFDQYWKEEVRTGLGLEVEIGDDGIQVSERRFAIDRSGVVCPEPSERPGMGL